jgi:hypothetical protein
MCWRCWVTALLVRFVLPGPSFRECGPKMRIWGGLVIIFFWKNIVLTGLQALRIIVGALG